VAFTPAREFKDRRSLERTLEDPTFSAEVVLFHEYTHHFMLKNFATTYPGWYIEGFAEANATIMLRPDGSFVYGMPANHRARELTELPQLHVRKLLDPAYEFKSGTEAIQKYSLGWLLTHYLAFSKDRAGQMQTYLSLLGKGTPGMAAAEQAFGDLDSLNRELSKYKGTNLPAREVILANFVKPVVTTRLLAPNEEQIMRHRIRLSRGVSRSEARGIASTLWGQAAARPQDLALQVLAAEAHLDASKHAEAITLADRALAINPDSVDALVYKARALFEAKQGTDDRFAKARDLLIKARDIDAKDPRPLIELYRSYRASPVRPIPESALIALDNAYDLALHDRTFRVLLARQLMEEGRARPAEQVLAPLAYGYDGNDPEDNFAANAMKKMKAGDMAGALAILNKQLKGVDGLDEDD
jgi:tetratricopeptide (TPR) repeat protein